MVELVVCFAIGFVLMWIFTKPKAGTCPQCGGSIPVKTATKCMHCGSSIYLE